MRKWITRILLLMAITILLVSSGFYFLNKEDPNYLINFIRENPENVSVYIQNNDDTLFAMNEDKMLPLASLFKIVIAIELVNQYEEGKINLDEKIPIENIEEYNYIDKINANYILWKNEVVKDQQVVSLYEVAKGMITYSANPNTDYIMMLLGEEEINNTARKLTENKHTNIYPIGASVLIPYYLKDIKDMEKKEIMKLISTSSKEEYEALVAETYAFLRSKKYDEESLNSFYPSDEQQRLWSNRTPRSTSQEYMKILKTIDNLNKKDKYNKLLISLLEIEHTNSYYKIGKNGETINTINKAVKVHNDTEEIIVVVLSHDLGLYEQIKMKNNIDSFISKVVNKEYTFK